MTHQFNPHILREYDIRGTFGTNLSPADGLEVGRRFGTWVRQQGQDLLCVGRDGRLSSPDLFMNLMQGLQEAGVNVIDIGVGPTPMLYFATKTTPAFAGIMITGSHNPGEDNGFKITLKDEPFFGEQIKALATQAFIPSPTPGTVEHVDMRGDYTQRMLKDWEKPQRRLKLAWDPGNGAAGEIVELLTQGIDAEHYVMNTEIDGHFPNHHPDPSVDENLEQLRQVVLDKGCDAGIAFDGDADRLGVIDSQGRAFYGDQILLILAQAVLQKNPGAKIIADVKTSDGFYESIRTLGGDPIMCRTGHSFVKIMTKQTKALLAGEMSGHIFFADKYYGYDDALYSAVRFINVLQSSNLTSSQIYDRLPKFHATPEMRITCADDVKFDVIEKIKVDFRQSHIPFSDIDGVRYKDDHGWWLLRASNTQPRLVARCESKTPEGLAHLKDHLNRTLHTHYKGDESF